MNEETESLADMILEALNKPPLTSEEWDQAMKKRQSEKRERRKLNALIRVTKQTPDPSRHPPASSPVQAP